MNAAADPPCGGGSVQIFEAKSQWSETVNTAAVASPNNVNVKLIKVWTFELVFLLEILLKHGFKFLLFGILYLSEIIWWFRCGCSL